MTAYATTADIESAWRPLVGQEVDNAEFFLEYASEIIRSQIPSVDTRIAAGTLSAVLVKGVVVAMVLRALKNPDGYRSVQQAIEDYSETRTRDASLSTGAVYLTEAEECMLVGRGNGAFSIVPSQPVTTCAVLERVALNRAWRDEMWPDRDWCPW